TRRQSGSGLLACSTAPGDGLLASPVVQLYNESDPTFTAAIDGMHASNDLVFVITNDGCGDTTHNRIIAYWSSDLTLPPLWTFTSDSSIKVDAGHGCSLDYATNTLYCGTDLADGSSGQNSLFAVNTITGELRWAANAGAVIGRPELASGR